MRQARDLSIQRMALQDALLLLQLLRVRVTAGNSLWLREILCAATDGSFQVLHFPGELEFDAEPKRAVESFLHRAGVQLMPEEAAALLREALECALTRTETAARLEYYCELLQRQLETLCQREKRDKKLFLQLGWMGGALLAVILW